VATQFVPASLTSLPEYWLFCGQVAWVHTQVLLSNVFPRLPHLACASVKDTVWYGAGQYTVAELHAQLVVSKTPLIFWQDALAV